MLRAARERLGAAVTDTREVNPGEVWEENEFWIELSWRIDPDGALGIRQYHESRARPGSKLTVDEYYGWMFEHSVPGLPERAAAEGRTPLEWMRRYGAFEISRGQGAVHEQEVPEAELEDVAVGEAGGAGGTGRVYTAAPAPDAPNIVPMGAPAPDDQGRRAVGVMVDGVVRRGFPTPSGRLEVWSSTLAGWGWPEHAPTPGYIRSHVHPSALDPGQVVLLSTFRLPTHDPHPFGQQQVAGRAVAHQPGLDPPVGRGPVRCIARTGDLIRVETEIGYWPWPRRGSPRASARAWSRARTTWAAGSCPGRARPQHSEPGLPGPEAALEPRLARARLAATRSARAR